MNVQSAFKDNLTPEQFQMVLLGAMVTAMSFGQVVRFTYDGKDRVVQPHAIGTSTKDGSLVLRGYQIAGESSRGTPSWSLFSVSKISPGEFFVLDHRVFNQPAKGYKMDDSQMATVLAQVEATA